MLEKILASLDQYGYWILFTFIFSISFLLGIPVGLNHVNHISG